MAFSRRKFLLGLGGAVVGMPFFEGLVAKDARADATPDPYALFYRRGNGVQQAIFDRNSYPSIDGFPNSQPREAERWWPMQTATTPIPYGPLATFGPISALSEIEPYVSKTTLVRGLRHPYGTENGHPEGAAQGLTGAGLIYPNDQPSFQSCTPLGESLDNLIAGQLQKDSAVSLYMGVKTNQATGVSWRRTGSTIFPRSAEESLVSIFTTLFAPYATTPEQRELFMKQNKSVNDLIRSDVASLRADKRMSKEDQDRLTVHLEAIHETQVALQACTIPAGLGGEAASDDGNSIRATVKVMGKMAALAISCGIRRSVLINIGVPQDIITYGEVPGAGTYEFHAISHRQVSESNATPLAAGQALHHAIDRYHLQQFKQILDILDAYPPINGKSLVDYGVNVHFSDLGSGQHIVTQLPYLYVGGANGKLKTGQYVDVGKTYLSKFLNTIGAAVGCTNADGQPLDDFNAKTSDGTDNNNYKSRNYCWNYYDVPQPPKPADGKPAITGRIDALIGP